MAENKIQLPSSGGGLVRYSDEIGAKLKIKPYVIIALIVLIIIVEIILYKGF